MCNERTKSSVVLGRLACAGTPILLGFAFGTNAFAAAADDPGSWLASTFGDWVSQPVFLDVRWITLLSAALVLSAVVLADTLLRRVIRRKIVEVKQATGERERRPLGVWFVPLLAESIQPLTLLVWIFGLYAAVGLVVRDLGHAPTAQKVLDVMGISIWAGFLVALLWLVHRGSRHIESFGSRMFIPGESRWGRVVIPHIAKTVRRVLPLVVLIFGIPLIPFAPDVRGIADNVVALLVIGAGALILLQFVRAAEEFILAQYDDDTAQPYQARRIRTQVTVLRKIVVVVISVFTLASMLMVFESVRQFGASILASAGIAGIVIGLAAQRSIGTLLAGFQVALTRPIRIDDVVIVENEWGRIEDITLTFVIVAIWDQRRLILPITYFMEHPFENWTSTSSDILGTVFFHVDYTMPIEPLREELDRILAKSTYWDGRLRSILVTDAKENTLQVRAMASAADGDQAWFLRCELREKLVDFVQKNYPESLPRLRAELRSAEAA